MAPPRPAQPRRAERGAGRCRPAQPSPSRWGWLRFGGTRWSSAVVPGSGECSTELQPGAVGLAGAPRARSAPCPQSPVPAARASPARPGLSQRLSRSLPVRSHACPVPYRTSARPRVPRGSLMALSAIPGGLCPLALRDPSSASPSGPALTRARCPAPLH